MIELFTKSQVPPDVREGPHRQTKPSKVAHRTNKLSSVSQMFQSKH